MSTKCKIVFLWCGAVIRMYTVLQQILYKHVPSHLSDAERLAGPSLASRPRRLKYGLVSIAWVIVHMRKLSYPDSG